MDIADLLGAIFNVVLVLFIVATMDVCWVHDDI
jgi:hypothetical protein